MLRVDICDEADPMLDWSTILPPRSNAYRGSRISLYFLFAIACMFTFRGTLHVKPLPVVPPGQIGVYLMLPLTMLLFLLPVRKPAKATDSAAAPHPTPA